jgi:hypothetical protein
LSGDAAEEGIDMIPDIKEWCQIAAWLVAVVGGLIAAFKAITELRRSNDQRQEDLRWKRAEMAKTCIDELNANSLARSALKMLDWAGRTYVREDGKHTGEITDKKRRDALRTYNTEFPPDDTFIRDAFDGLLDYCERFEHFIRIGLIVFDDVEPFFRYYVAKLAGADERDVITRFMNVYDFTLGLSFLDRFDAWRNK